MMSQWRLFEGDTAEVSTQGYHQHRDRGRHLEQNIDRERLQCAAILCLVAQRRLGCSATVSDLGCGDGGLLSLLKGHVGAAWGYDFTPANVAGWEERQVSAELLDFLADEHIRLGQITAITETLEHLTDPHSLLQRIARTSPYIVASSPWDETGDVNCDCHAWAWDLEGYRALLEQGGFKVLECVVVGRFQVLLGERT